MTLVKPSYGMSTPKVYQALNLQECSFKSYEEILKSRQWVNDLEPAAFRLEPRLSSLKQTLQGMGFDQVVMSGSGSAMICFGHREISWEPESSLGSFFPLHPIQRKEKEWYSTKEVSKKG